MVSQYSSNKILAPMLGYLTPACLISLSPAPVALVYSIHFRSTTSRGLYTCSSHSWVLQFSTLPPKALATLSEILSQPCSERALFYFIMPLHHHLKLSGLLWVLFFAWPHSPLGYTPLIVGLRNLFCLTPVFLAQY